MPTAAAVVIGSGAFGASTAYHLARRWADLALVDQHALGSQTSPRAAGLTGKADRPGQGLERPGRAARRRVFEYACAGYPAFTEAPMATVDWSYHRKG